MATGWACAIAFLLQSLLPSLSAANKVYIVQMKYQQKPGSYATQTEWYSDLIPSAPNAILYTYEAAYHGFAAVMLPDQADSLRHHRSVLQVHEDKPYTLHTTRTHKFLGLNNPGLWPDHTLRQLHKASQYVIIGVVDTGVWPESPSFQDKGLPEVPSRWLGACEPGPDPQTRFCNKKLIGARFFSSAHDRMAGATNESRSVRDQAGHGSHTASTAAGSGVVNSSLWGYAKGVARGMAYGARLAVYKACWEGGCFGSDILAAVDRATKDGVNILSLSVGGQPGVDYADDPIAVAAFSAAERGIVVSCSAGNSGPFKGSVINVAPWILTIGAGTLDREFPAFVALGNDKTYTGVSLYSGEGMGGKPAGLVYMSGNNSSKLCLSGSLDPASVEGKVVVCDRGVTARVAKGLVVRDAGGVGMILANTREAGGEELVADSHLLPALAVGRWVGDRIRQHAMSPGRQTALLTFGGTVLGIKPAPAVATFSSRGPNPVTPQILKPDVIAPGVNILAAWSEAVGPTSLPDDTRRTQFNIISGTSMSCPHVSGLAALLKAAHPDWGPGAIKSALVTTASTLDNTNSPLRDSADNSTSNPWIHGAGHVDIHRALAPGLVYNTTTRDHIAFLCSINYTIDMIQNIAKRQHIKCPIKPRQPGQINYPSFSVVFEKSRNIVEYSRELTNVGEQGSVYGVSIEAPRQVAVNVTPEVLVFGDVGSRRRFTVRFVSRKGVDGLPKFGSITWEGGENRVKSPVSFTWKEF